jgi:hypothetical protein
MNVKHTIQGLIAVAFSLAVVFGLQGCDRYKEVASLSGVVLEPRVWKDPVTGCEFLIFESVNGVDVERRDPSCGIAP